MSAPALPETETCQEREALQAALSEGVARLRRLRDEGALPFMDDGSLEHAVLPLALRLLFSEGASAAFAAPARRTGAEPRSANSAGMPRVVALVGAPGCGKSTLSDHLAELFADALGMRVAQLSLDDLYLPLSARRCLAQRVHPLFAQRGPPGTHDVALGRSTLASLRSAQPKTLTWLPRFDKSTDDRVPDEQCSPFVGRPDWILLDAWLWEVEAPSESALLEPLNEREAREDPSGVWRRHAAQALSLDYPELFREADEWVLLESPSFDATVRFRMQQERALGSRARLQGEAEVRHFLQLFERWLALPRRSAATHRMVIDDEHRLRLCTAGRDR